MDQPPENEPGFDLGVVEPQAPQAAYRVLARKYRPQNFDDLIGQEAMVRTLSNAFDTGRIAQAYMFTGVRGVGKTTTARILARALNYEISGEIDRPSIHLDRLGTHCQAIMEGRHVDVMEIDAASHTGIDDVRQITDGARYAPVSARYKVYIVDEVHMLSEKAWNAFLKTLEEPPAHVKFMFATTEIRKVPVTVLSRCQRFDLRRVDADVLTRHLQGICDQEKVAVDGEALGLIARAGEGSVRDSLSILDQAIAHGAGHVTSDEVRRMLGLADRGRVIDLFEHLMKGDIAAAMAELKSQYDDGADPEIVLTELAEFVHFVTRVKVVPAAADDLSLSETERKRGRSFAETLSHRVLSRAWQMLMKGIEEVGRSPKPFASADMVLVRIAYAADLPTPDEALRMLAEGMGASGAAAPRLPAGGGNGGGASGTSSGGASAARLQSVPQASPNPVTMAARPAAAPQVQPGIALGSLTEIVALAAEKRDILLKNALERDVRLVRCEDGRLDIALTGSAAPTLAGEIQKKLSDWTGRRWMVSISREEGEQTIRERQLAEQADRERGVRAHPAVQAIMARFPGAEIIAVRPMGDAGGPPAAVAAPVERDDDEDTDSWEPVAPWDDDF
ncbi:DNA polymerase III subunit gamma/tau [Phreatobacter aquaticus]|uniref:DNA polymerase III subunit gamma/tau n=1 Tax=Phreatobacter aquaticus TaxID=2570229 RepID=A0A4D7QCG9_9HYPH|nr:DNA polymerase III subunit gamma/tau [Phreatobacter aquaticus]QCK85700.1 DNA polymerase III subunit gamma/tau [Phreatobacter aquaticus]